MDAEVIGIVHRKGTSTKSGSAKAYDFAIVLCIVPVKIKATDKMVVDAVGFETAEVPCKPELLNMARGMKFPGKYRLQIDNEFGSFGQIQPVCTRIDPVEARIAGTAPGRAA